MQELIDKIGMYILKEEELDSLYSGIIFLGKEEQGKVLEKIKENNQKIEIFLDEIVGQMDMLSGNDKNKLVEKLEKHINNIRNNKHIQLELLNGLNKEDYNFNNMMHNYLNFIIKLEHRELLYFKIQNYLLTKQKIKRIGHDYYRN